MKGQAGPLPSVSHPGGPEPAAKPEPTVWIAQPTMGATPRSGRRTAAPRTTSLTRGC